MKNITDYIKIYKKALPDNFCKLLISKATENQGEWAEAKAIKGRNQYRSATFFTMIDREYKTKKGRVFNFDPMLYATIGNLLKLYQKSFKNVHITSDEGYQLLRYKTGDFHTEHIDNCVQSQPRKVSIVIMCNDDFEGGELKFHGDHVVSLGVGDAIIFPSNFMFPHQVSTITKGIRYVVSAFCN